MGTRLRLLALLVAAACLLCGCSAPSGDWTDPLSAENEEAMDQFFLKWAYYTVQHPPEEVDSSWQTMATCASRWHEGLQSSGDVGRVQVGLCPGTDLFATVSLGHVVRAQVTYAQDSGQNVSGEDVFVTACEACLYALGEYDFAGVDPQGAFLQLLTALEADSRVRAEGKIPSATSEYNGCSMELATDEEQTSLLFEISHVPRRY